MWIVDKELQSKLVSAVVKERAAYIEQHPKYKFIGETFVLFYAHN